MYWKVEGDSDFVFCMKPPKTIGDSEISEIMSQKKVSFLLVHACAFCGVCMVFA